VCIHSNVALASDEFEPASCGFKYYGLGFRFRVSNFEEKCASVEELEKKVSTQTSR